MHPWNQKRLESVLQRAADRLPHALLVHGPRGVGKLAFAERMAQALLCEAKTAARPCARCDACRWFAAGNHPDFRRLEPEALRKVVEGAEDEAPAPGKKTRPSTEIKIEQVRELAHFLNLRSHRGALRIALVHPAEAMNPNAANALLKSLEEPPAGAVFILVSHSPASLLPTVRSRCQALPVGLPSREEAVAWLKEQGAKDPDRWLAYAGGAPLRALEYASNGPAFERLIRSPDVVATRDELPPLVDALQKAALDRALASFGLPPKYQTSPPAGADARVWLRYARKLSDAKGLAQHEVNPQLFSAELLLGRPKE